MLDSILLFWIAGTGAHSTMVSAALFILLIFCLLPALRQ
jgi:hypothetical protein